MQVKIAEWESICSQQEASFRQHKKILMLINIQRWA